MLRRKHKPEEIDAAIGRGLRLPVSSISWEQATARSGDFACFAPLDVLEASRCTRQDRSWTPAEPGLSPGLTTA